MKTLPIFGPINDIFSRIVCTTHSPHAISQKSVIFNFFSFGVEFSMNLSLSVLFIMQYNERLRRCFRILGIIFTICNFLFFWTVFGKKKKTKIGNIREWEKRDKKKKRIRSIRSFRARQKNYILFFISDATRRIYAIEFLSHYHKYVQYYIIFYCYYLARIYTRFVFVQRPEYFTKNVYTRLVFYIFSNCKIGIFTCEKWMRNTVFISGKNRI